MNENVFLNGEYYRGEDAKISIDDRGFLFGDGVYEVIRCYEGKFFKLDEHLARLEKSAGKIFITIPYSRDEIRDICLKLLAKSGVKTGKMYMQVTRGIAPRIHEFPEGIIPTVMMKADGFDEAGIAFSKKGIGVMTFPDERWAHCDIKSLNLLYNVISKQKARSNGAYEAVFVHEVGVTECASSNIFAVMGGKLVTAPEGSRILSGITRDTVLKLAEEAGIPCELRYPQKDELFKADEVFISNTAQEVSPVLTIDGKTVANGKPGEITLKLQKMFEDEIEGETSERN